MILTQNVLPPDQKTSTIVGHKISVIIESILICVQLYFTHLIQEEITDTS